MALAGLLIAGSLVPHWIAFAQDQTRLTFEVASIKPGDPAPTSFGLRFTPGRVVAENVPLRYLIMWAYHVRDFQIEGGPAWTESARYEVVAKAQGNAAPDQLQLMLQALLEDRFRLKLHRGTEQRTAYLLVPAKGGLKLPESAADCAALADEPPANGKSKFQCNAWFASDDQFTGTKISMTQFGEWLSDQLGRPVVDRTGLTGLVDIHLQWSTDDQADSPNAAPAIMTAVQEQMGVKIESGKGPVEILTIDHAEKPDPN
jgi:uncharacterized protein (TIGR03435 family)